MSTSERRCQTIAQVSTHAQGENRRYRADCCSIHMAQLGRSRRGEVAQRRSGRTCGPLVLSVGRRPSVFAISIHVEPVPWKIGRSLRTVFMLLRKGELQW